MRLIDPSISVDEQISASVKWASRTTKEDRAIFVLPGDNSAGQLAFQFVQLRSVTPVVESLPLTDSNSAYSLDKRLSLL